jgi:hypothetical protein
VVFYGPIAGAVDESQEVLIGGNSDFQTIEEELFPLLKCGKLIRENSRWADCEDRK